MLLRPHCQSEIACWVRAQDKQVSVSAVMDDSTVHTFSVQLSSFPAALRSQLRCCGLSF